MASDVNGSKVGSVIEQLCHEEFDGLTAAVTNFLTALEDSFTLNWGF